MIRNQQPNGLNRRILTFPAVHPSDFISPATLLTSLVHLAREICKYKSRFFASNRRNANEAIRQVGVLLVFLEETLDRLEVDLPGSAVLSFSELHLAFQEILHLLEDCTREGARLWMLMKSEFVANQFRVLFRSIATDLDVLPLNSLYLSVEVTELVELIAMQSRKARFEVAPKDKEAFLGLKSILNTIEDAIVPNKRELRRVFDYLGIKKWSLCNKEVKFLESEMALEWLSSDNRELDLLSSLMAVAAYCRCVLFDFVDETFRQTDGGHNKTILRGLNPDDFRCPITLEFMNDPVTIETGHTYDRSSIGKWLRAGNPICPKTGKKLISKEAIPNLALRRIIQLYCIENGIALPKSGNKKQDITMTVSAGSLGAERAAEMVAEYLATRLSTATEEGKNKAAFEIRLLSKKSIFYRSCMVEAGVIPSLLDLLHSSDSLSQENSSAALLNLSKHSTSKSQLMENDGLNSIVHVLKNGSKVEARQNAAGILFYIASIEKYRRLIGENHEAIQGLIDQIRNGPNRSKKNAMVAIFGILIEGENHRLVLEFGLIPLLINLLASKNDDLALDSLAILAILSEKPDGASEILQSGGLDLFIGLVDTIGSKAGKEYCISLLIGLCKFGGENVEAQLAKSKSLMGALYSVISHGSTRARKRVTSLIRILHRYHENKLSLSSPSVNPDFSQELFINVRYPLNV